MPEDELLAHTDDAGEKVVDRTQELLHQLAESVVNLNNGLGKLAQHVAHLEVQRAVENVPEIARTGVNDAIDTVGAGGEVAGKAVDVPLAISQDVIHDAGDVASDVKQDAVKTRKKLFRRKRG